MATTGNPPTHCGICGAGLLPGEYAFCDAEFAKACKARRAAKDAAKLEAATVTQEPGE